MTLTGAYIQVETREMADTEAWWSKVPPIQENTLNSAVGIAELRAQSSPASSSGTATPHNTNGASAHMFMSRTNGGGDGTNGNNNGAGLTHRHSRFLPIPGPKEVYIKGYATSSPASPVSRVEVCVCPTPSGSTEGTTETKPKPEPETCQWHPATITYREGPWSWVLWEACVPVTEGEEGAMGGTVYSRAVDDRGEVQRSGEEVEWNLRGMGYDGYGEREF